MKVLKNKIIIKEYLKNVLNNSKQIKYFSSNLNKTILISTIEKIYENAKKELIKLGQNATTNKEIISKIEKFNLISH